jgi:hypothetical protein
LINGVQERLPRDSSLTKTEKFPHILMPGQRRQSEPVYAPTESPVRALTDEEIGRLERRLGQPVDRDFLVGWVSQAIRDVVRLSQEPTARELRDSFAQIAAEGRRWIRDVEACPGVSRLSHELDQVKSTVARFCDQADRLANRFGTVVKRGQVRTPFALEGFISRMIGIAKTAKVYPSSEGRALRSQTAPRPPSAFFYFVVEALGIAEKVIQSSALTEDRKQAALSILDVKSRGALSKLIERLRGKISDYRESEHGLVIWPVIDPNAD